MGIRAALGMKRYQEDISAGVAEFAPVYGADPSTFPIASPWSSSSLERIVFEDVFGADGPPSNTRQAAMAVPAIARARSLICNTVARMPLRAVDDAGAQLPAEKQPGWLYRTNKSSPRQRMVWTLDDLIFYGWSCWWRDNDSDGWPLHGQRLNMGTWSISHDLKVIVNGSPVPDENVLLIPGYHEGILTFGKGAIADTQQLYFIVRDRLANPVPMTELHQVSGADLNTTEQDTLVDHWRVARSQKGGGVGFTNKHIELRTHGGDGDATLLIEARNAAAVDMARLVGISAGMLDATAPKASLNYETKAGRLQEFIDLDLSGYMGPIEDRLSLDDVVPRGTRIAFDRGDTTAPVPAATGPILQD